MYSKYYTRENIFSPLGFFLILATTFILGCLLSYPYLMLMKVIPLIYLNVLITIGTGIILGYMAARISKSLKFLSPVWGFIALLMGFMGFTAIKWAIYVYIMAVKPLNYGFFTGMKLILSSPRATWEIIRLINASGTWSLMSSGENVTGISLWIVWLAEILVIFISLWKTYNNIIGIPFIESDNNWAIAHKNILTFNYFDIKKERSNLEYNPLSLFEHHPTDVIPNGRTYITADLYSSSDGSINYLSLNVHAVGSRGLYNTSTPIKYLCVDAEFMNMLSNYHTINYSPQKSNITHNI